MGRSSVISTNSVQIPQALSKSACVQENNGVHKGRKISFMPGVAVKVKKFFSMAAAKIKDIFSGRNGKSAKLVISAVIPGAVERRDDVGPKNRLTPVAEEPEAIFGSARAQLFSEAPEKPPRMDPLEAKRIDDDLAAAKLAAEKLVVVESPEDILGSAAEKLFTEFPQAEPYEMPVYSRALGIRAGYADEKSEVRFAVWAEGASDRLAKNKFTPLFKLLDGKAEYNARLTAIGARIGAEG